MKIELTEETINTVRRYNELVMGDHSDIGRAELDELTHLRRAIAMAVAARVGAEDKWEKMNNADRSENI